MFDRTTNGIKNTPLFYRGKLLIYVEGPDDVSFWSNVFPNKVGNRTPKFKPVGGDISLEERVRVLTDRNISEDQKNFIVARDSHYRKIAKELSNDRKVIETEYHSIENVMLCKCMITKTIRGLSRKISYPESSVERWLKKYDEHIYPIMVIDFLNKKSQGNKSVMDNGCYRLLLNPDSSEFDANKISQHVINSGFKECDILQAGIDRKIYKPRYYSRGHFYFSAVLKFIKSEVKKLDNKSARISKDSLFTMALQLCSKCKSKNGKINKLIDKAKIATQSFYN